MNKKIYILIVLLSMISITAYGQLSGIRICIDPGHGGHDPVNDRRIELPNGIIYWESEGNFTTSVHLKNILELLGASVKTTRTDNTDASDISLSSRSEIANQFNADYFHSNHTNAGSSGNNYSLVLYNGEDDSPTWSDAKEMGKIMAPYLQDLLKTTSNTYRGDRSFLGYNLGVLKNTNMPGTLSEGSFHDIEAEGLRLKNSEYLKNYAWAIAKSFCSYFDVEGISTGRVGGIVTDRATGKPINNVNVRCEDCDKKYTGDDFYNGFYALGALEEGEHTLIFSRSGYFNLTKNIKISKNQYLDLDISLPPDLNGGPYVDFYISGLPAGSLEELTFDASASYDNGEIVSFDWDFGDGQTDTGKVVKHVYQQDGIYDVSLFLTDDENNTNHISKTIEIKSEPPVRPTLLSVEQQEQGTKIKWKRSTEVNIKGYRLYYRSPNLEQRILLADTNILKADITQYIDSSTQSDINYYHISAVNNLGMESLSSDSYGTFSYPFDTNDKLLIVDGFHRIASYAEPTHEFVCKTYLHGLLEAEGHVDASSCMNESIINGNVNLLDYDIVFWFLGDESTKDETFDTTEQKLVIDYLKKGGKLFVTGSEIAWDLDKKGSSSDKSFFNTFFKAKYLLDGIENNNPAKGIDLGFEDVVLNFGEVYPEDYPDVILGIGGAKPIFKYKDDSNAGIAYKGTFYGQKPGALVYLAFSLETVADQKELKVFFERLLEFFDTKVSIEEAVISDDIQVYPTVVEDEINIASKAEQVIQAKAIIFDSTGKSVKAVNLNLNRHETRKINVSNLEQGIYILQITNGTWQKITKFIKH